MAIYVRGNGVENAIGYQLYKKVGENHYPVDEKRVGKRTIEGSNIYIDAFGNEHSNANALTSTLIDIADFDENDTTLQNFNIGLPNGLDAATTSVVSFYKKEGGNATFIEGMNQREVTELWAGVLSAGNLVAKAKFLGANRVRFTVNSTAELWFYRANKINFCLDDYTTLAAGETHQLVVKAIAPTDGVDTDDDGTPDLLYVDSDYGGDVNGNPLEYVDGTIYTNDASKWVQQSISNTGDLSYPGDTGFNRSNIMAVEKFAAGETITVISKSERLMVALVSYDANGAFASRSSWVGLDPAGANGEVSTTFTSENPFNVVIATNSETNYTLEQMLNIVTVIGNK